MYLYLIDLMPMKCFEFISYAIIWALGGSWRTWQGEHANLAQKGLKTRNRLPVK